MSNTDHNQNDDYFAKHLTKHCTGCGKNLGVNYFIEPEGTYSELCKYCRPVKKPKKS